MLNEKPSAADRYMQLSSDRTTFLDTARDCARVSLPYLIPPTGTYSGQRLPTPWQSMGAKGVNVMASKLMLSLFPVNTSFFKLQINDGEFTKDPNIDARAKTEIDQSLSRMERVVNQHLAESQDRVVLFQAMKHLVVAGNVLVYLGPKQTKIYPLDRYVCSRDGNGEPIEILTVESIHRSLLPEEFRQNQPTLPNHTGAETQSPVSDVLVGEEEVAVYTWAKLVDGKWKWRQEADGQIIPGTEGSANKTQTPWLPLRFNVVDGEDYGRGRIEEYLGDLKSLEGLMQALVEGSAASAKVVFLVAPSATTKPSDLAKARNGAMITGRPEDVTVVQVDKRADFQTVLQMIQMLTQRLSEAFLVMSVRDSERTTAEEIRATQQELNEQLGGNLGNLTTELLQPYLRRKLFILQRDRQLPQLPKGVVFPTIVTGIEGIGRGQDREALAVFLTTIQQTLGPEAIQQYVNMEEVTKRLAASVGIDTLGLIKTQEDRQQEQQQALAQQEQISLTNQTAQMMKAPIFDPTKNPEAATQLNEEQAAAGQQPEPATEGGPSPSF
jgi:hypothetical protein